MFLLMVMGDYFFWLLADGMEGEWVSEWVSEIGVVNVFIYGHRQLFFWLLADGMEGEWVSESEWECGWRG